MTPSLNPSGAHLTPLGRTRYAIWLWIDADGETRIPCGILDHLHLIADIPRRCSDPKPRLTFTDTRTGAAHRAIMRRAGLIDIADRLTEKGAVILSHFRRRELVRAGLETPHGLRKRPPPVEVPF